MSDPKYAPARENGDKPYVVNVWNWGKLEVRIGWGATKGDAIYDVMGRKTTGIYASGAWRATPADIAHVSSPVETQP